MSVTFSNLPLPNFDVYSFTYSKSYKKSDVQDKSDYNLVFDVLNKYGHIENHCFEIGKLYNRLHLHGTVKIYNDVPKSRFRIKGFHGKLDLIYDQIGWDNYMIKEAHGNLFQSQQEENIFPPIPRDC